MNILIIGAGNVGYNLADYFSSLGHYISLVEKDRSRCDLIESKLDVLVVNGLGSDPAVLAAAEMEFADMVIAVTSNDETNLLACNFAMQSGVRKRIARIKSDIYTNKVGNIDLEKTGVTSLVETERGIVERIFQYVELPGVLETANFQSNQIYLRGYKVTEDMPIAKKPLKEIREMAGDSPMLFVVIRREGKNILPTGERVVLPGDQIVVIMPRESFPTFRTLINSKNVKMKKIIVSGSTLTAIHLAEAVKPLADKVLLLDPEQEHGEIAAATLDGVDVFHGESTDSSLLDEINVKDADCFIAAGDPENNIMSCLMAKAEGAKMVIAIREDDRYSSLFDSIGLDHVINTREITLNSIIERIQTVAIGTYLKLKSSDTEVMRLKIGRRSVVIGKPLRELDKKFRKAIIIGCVIRGDEIIIPSGNTIIQGEDETIVFTQRENLKWLHKLFNPPVS